MRVDLRAGDYDLFSRGLRVLIPGWMDIYGEYAKQVESILPDLTEGDTVALVDVRAVGKTTAPPSRFNHASLLKVLEKEGLGTKATRAGIVDSIRSRGYTLNDHFEMSTLGYALFETLQEYLPVILTPEFTRRLELDMDSIQTGVTDRKAVLSRAREDLLGLLELFRSKEGLIGNDLVAGLQRFWKESEDLGTCPKCGEGRLLIVRSNKTGKRFVGCSGYKDGSCDQTFPLPQKGTISPLDKVCPHCGYQMIKVVSGRRGWETCLNWTQCPGRQEDLRLLEERRNKTKGADTNG
jgi:DNA topoisomerase-1